MSEAIPCYQVSERVILAFLQPSWWYRTAGVAFQITLPDPAPTAPMPSPEANPSAPVAPPL